MFANHIIRAVFLSCLLLVFPPVYAAVYKWVDEHGQVHYGEKPGHEAAREVELKPAPNISGTTSTAPKPPVDRDKMIRILEQERQERQAVKNKKRKALRKRKINCTRAKNKLSKSQRARNVYGFDDKGDRVRMNTEQRQRITEKYQAEIKRYCD